MTREEQIDWLCRLRSDLNNGVIFTPWNKEFTEALNDVLEQEPTNKDLTCAYAKGVYDTREETATIIDKIRAEIIQVVAEENTEDSRWALGLKYSIKIIDKYKAEKEVE